MLTVVRERDRMHCAATGGAPRARSSMVEQWPFKPLVAGSSPAALTTVYVGDNEFFIPTGGGLFGPTQNWFLYRPLVLIYKPLLNN